MRTLKTLRGGGLRIIALLFALLLIIPISFNTVKPAEAADEGYTLYMGMDQIVPVKTDLKFTSLSTSRDGDITYAMDTSGKCYRLNTAGQVIPTSNPCADSAVSTGSIPGHSARGSASNMPELAIDGDELVVSADSDGRAWIRETWKTTDSPGHRAAPVGRTAPTIIQGTENISFAQVAQINDGNRTADAYWLGSPRPQTSPTTIAQMPTAGAPEGNTVIGLIGLCVALSAVLLVRRRA